MRADPSLRIVAAESAVAEIGRLGDEHGSLMFFQSGGCCDGSSPMCFPDGELLLGPDDLLLGEVDGCPFYIDADHERVEPDGLGAGRLVVARVGALERRLRSRHDRRTLA